MPAASKTRWSQLRVGLMAMFALAILAFLILLLSSTNPLFKKTTDMYTFVGDSSAMTAGSTPVRLNGILIGKVTHIELSGSSDPARAVRVTLAINNEFLGLLPVDSQIKLAQQNLLGARFVNIRKGQSQQIVQPGGEISSLDTTELDDLFDQGNATLAALQSILKRADGIISTIEAGQGTIGKLLVDDTLYNRALGIVDEVHKLSLALNSPDSSMGKLIHEDVLYEDYRGIATRMNTLLDGLNAGEGAAGKLLKDPAIYDETLNTIADLRELLGRMNHGDGTVSKLLNTDEFHEQLKTTLGRMDTLLDKISNGQGTLSQLLNNPLLYENLTGATGEMQGLMKDFRSNPKKFLRIKLAIF